MSVGVEGSRVGNPKYVSRFIGLHIRDEAIFERDAKMVSELWRAVGTDASAVALKSAGAPVFGTASIGTKSRSTWWRIFRS